MTRLVAALSTALLFVVSVGFIAYVRFIAPPGNFFHHGIDTPAVVRQVQQMNDLVTVRYIVEKVIALKQDRVPLGSESILLLVQARVLAGVHLSDINQYDVSSPAAHSVRIRLPQPRIFDAYINEKQTKVWDRRITWWTPWVSPDPDLEHQARMAAIEQVRAAATEQGILRDAARNARESISNLLHALGISDVQFTDGQSKPQT